LEGEGEEALGGMVGLEGGWVRERFVAMRLEVEMGIEA